LKQRILITGATGFIGSNIINLLLEKKIYIYDILRKKIKITNTLKNYKEKKIIFQFFIRNLMI